MAFVSDGDKSIEVTSTVFVLSPASSQSEKGPDRKCFVGLVTSENLRQIIIQVLVM